MLSVLSYKKIFRARGFKLKKMLFASFITYLKYYKSVSLQHRYVHKITRCTSEAKYIVDGKRRSRQISYALAKCKREVRFLGDIRNSHVVCLLARDWRENKTDWSVSQTLMLSPDFFDLFPVQFIGVDKLIRPLLPRRISSEPRGYREMGFHSSIWCHGFTRFYRSEYVYLCPSLICRTANVKFWWVSDITVRDIKTSNPDTRYKYSIYIQAAPMLHLFVFLLYKREREKLVFYLKLF